MLLRRGSPADPARWRLLRGEAARSPVGVPGEIARAATFSAIVRPSVAVAGERAVAEGAVDRLSQLVDQQGVYQGRVGEVRLAQCQLDTQYRVVAQASCLCPSRSGGQEGVPRARGGVGGVVLDRVQQVGHPAEQAAGLGEGGRVGGSAGQLRRPGEGRRRGQFGGFGREQGRVPRMDRAFQFALPVNSFGEHRGVEPDP
jgi:hypothetical protein